MDEKDLADGASRHLNHAGSKRTTGDLTDDQLQDKAKSSLDKAVVYNPRGKSSATTVAQDKDQGYTGLWSRQEHLQEAGVYHLELTIRVNGKAQDISEQVKWLWRIVGILSVAVMTAVFMCFTGFAYLGIIKIPWLLP